MSDRIFRRTPDGNAACQHLDLIEDSAMRMVLMQVDGVQTQERIIKKLGGNSNLQRAFVELELQGFIYLSPEMSLSPKEEKPAQSIPPSTAESNALLAKLMAESGVPSQVMTDALTNPSVKKEKKVKKKKKDLPPPPPPPPVDTRTPEEIEEELRQQEEIFRARRLKFKHAARKEAERQARPLYQSVLTISAKAALVLLVVALLGILFFPYNFLRGEFADRLFILLNRRVEITSIAMHWGDEPYLRIQGIKDTAGGLSVEEAQVDFASLVKAWFNGAKWGASTKLRLNGVSVPLNDLFYFTDTWQSSVGENRTPFNLWQVDKLSVKTAQESFDFNSAEAHFSPDGKLEKWVVSGAESKWTLTLTAGGKKESLKVDFYAQDWIPFGKDIRLTGARAQGVVTEDGVDLSQTEVGVFGGRIEGPLKVNWQKGFQMEGSGEVFVMSLKNLARSFLTRTPLDGTISGKINLTSAQKTWESLWKNLLLKFDLTVNDGKFIAMNLPDILRSSQAAMGTPIGFSKMQTRGEWKQKQLNARIINMNAGQLLVNADFTVSPNLNVEGLWITDINSQVMRRELKMQISGPLNKMRAELIQDRSY